MSGVLILLFLGGLSDEPKLPVSDWGACPFECCVYGGWTATAEVRARAGRDLKAKQRFIIAPGESVKAETGL